MEKGALLYEGKAKRLYATDQEDVLFVEYKNSATAFNGQKKAEIEGKGILNNKISTILFEKLKQQGIESHFIQKVSENEQLVKKVEIIPLEVVVRNMAAGSFSERLGIEEGTPLKRPIVEFYYKNDALNDPLITNNHIEILCIATKEEVETLANLALKVNEALKEIFQTIGVILVDFKLEFGRDREGNILLADEISPDTCRLWDAETKEKLDKDVFRRDLGSLTDVYNIILSRLGGK
ncbi:phosphoribosylaminoimidazolesuccinocarboxamide synthase [Ureibacillus thermophilus]|uniref:phosphoribosylaminoimidazolesuccinocarboxamide synthase n=1 Tax=Ureibacillus thermophilus TaxID=367743 RepID=UPI003615ED4B